MKPSLTLPRQWALVLVVLALPLLLLFRKGFATGEVLRANDTPFGLLMAQADTARETFEGHWRPLNWLGTQELEALPGPTQAVFTVTSPVFFAKWHAPVALLFLGVAAWFYCRRSGFHPAVGVVTGLAAALNSNFLSYASWGLSSKCYALAFVFVALGWLQAGPGEAGWRRWARVALAGFAVGLNVTEGADVGAILSLFVAASVAWEVLANGPRKPAAWATGALALALVTASAAWVSARAVQSLTGFAIKGVQGMEPGTESAAQRWDYITGWSFPKVETVRLGVAGVYGYLTDTPDGGAYWGAVGPDGDPARRFSGSGEYAGIVVLVVALWALARSMSSAPGSPFTASERRRIWFWAGAGLVSLMLAWGRFFPLFSVVFSLPFLSTIRIPMKYLHVVHVSVLVVFAHGLEGMGRAWMAGPASVSRPGALDAMRRWWGQAKGFDLAWKRWVLGLGLAAVAGALLYQLQGTAVLGRIAQAGFKGEGGQPDDTARAILAFSQGEVWKSVVFLGLALAWTVALAARVISGPTVAWWAVGLLTAVDLFRADVPWVVHYNVNWRYQSNPVIERLQASAAQHWRMTSRMHPVGRSMLTDPADGYFPAIQNLWLEHHLQFYRIPTLDIIQMPRMPTLDAAFLGAFGGGGGKPDPRQIGRLWALTSTRSVLGMAGIEGQLDQTLATDGGKFVPVLRFALQPKPGVPQSMMGQPDSHTAVAAPNGEYALYEYTAALPRALVLTQWTVETNAARVASRLVDPAFKPSAEVILDRAPEGLKPSEGRAGASIALFQPRRVVVNVTNVPPGGGVLLLNDRWHEHWNATVDGQPTPLLRGNMIMRAVPVGAGSHVVEFRHDPPHGMFHVSLSALAAAALLLVAIVVPRRPSPISSPR